jgi:DNA mismatch endonuclease (patch repair protein)
MRRFRSTDTAPERALRSALHHRGLRFRLHRQVPGMARRTIDVAFPSAKVAVFVDGCYWHGCPIHGKTPQRNSAWWSEKLRRNVDRDKETNQALLAAGWAVVRAWEHEDADRLAEEIGALVRSRTKTGRGSSTGSC